MENVRLNTTAFFETGHASRHLKSLCDHFSRKVETQYDDKKGWVQFPFGRCDMIADQIHLALSATAEDQPQLDQVVQTVTNHLERFAFRENPALVWRQTKTINNWVGL